MFPYIGNKKKEIKEFEDFIPDVNIYVEVFGGSGALTLQLNHDNPDKLYHLNDIDKGLTDIYKYFKTGKIKNDVIKMKEIYDGYKARVNRSVNKQTTISKIGKESHTNRKKGILYELLHLKLQRYPNSSTITTTNFIPMGDRKTSNVDFTRYKASQLLKPKNIKITNWDYKEVLELYKDDKNAFLFLDPPYQDIIEESIISRTYKHRDFNIEDLTYILDYMKTAKCFCMMVINDSKLIKKQSKGLKILHKYDKFYSFSGRKVKHLVITNYIINTDKS